MSDTTFEKWFSLWDTTRDPEVKRLCGIAWNAALSIPVAAPVMPPNPPEDDNEFYTWWLDYLDKEFHLTAKTAAKAAWKASRESW